MWLFDLFKTTPDAYSRINEFIKLSLDSPLIDDDVFDENDSLIYAFYVGAIDYVSQTEGLSYSNTQSILEECIMSKFSNRIHKNVPDLEMQIMALSNTKNGYTHMGKGGDAFRMWSTINQPPKISLSVLIAKNRT